MSTSEVLEFLNPTEHGQISDAVGLQSFANSIPEYTTLTKDFFESLKTTVTQNGCVKQGDWVQVGVWRGGGALFLKALLTEIGLRKNLYLYDTFGKIPVDGISNKKDLDFIKHFRLHVQHSETDMDYYDDVVKLFERFEMQEGVRLIATDITSKEPINQPSRIGLLHLDVDFYEPTFSALNLFYDKVVPGGLIIIDDYYMSLLNCKEAVDAFFASRNVDLKVHGERLSTFAIKVVKPQ